MDLADFGMLVNSMDGNRGGDGDSGSIFPRSDATDLGNGARFIPGEVTTARRAGKKVQFQQPCKNQCCWFWQMPDGSRIYHYEISSSEQLKKENEGVCPNCGNDYINGGTMSVEQATAHNQKTTVTNTATLPNVRKAAVDVLEINDPTFIYNQEAAGQEELVKSDTLPSNIDSESKKILEEAGVKFGNPVDGDPIFTYAELPAGWKKIPTDHSMWSNLVDETGKVRAQIFYKAAFYDRSAHISASRD